MPFIFYCKSDVLWCIFLFSQNGFCSNRPYLGSDETDHGPTESQLPQRSSCHRHRHRAADWPTNITPTPPSPPLPPASCPKCNYLSLSVARHCVCQSSQVARDTSVVIRRNVPVVTNRIQEHFSCHYSAHGWHRLCLLAEARVGGTVGGITSLRSVMVLRSA